MKTLLSFAALTAGLLATTGAQALELGTPAQQSPYRSAQNFALELRFGPYSPAVDDEPGLAKDANGNGPFEAAFGGKSRFYVGLELDWQVLRIPYVGTIGPGLGVGLVTMSRDAMTKESVPRKSGDDYSFTIYPFYGAAVLRVDTFWREAGVPLVPYAKLGLGYGLWRASTSTGTSEVKVSDSEVRRGTGGTWGTHMAFGVGVPLDFLDRGAARNMDNATGINNTYLYGELYWMNLNGLFQDEAMYVGTKSWVLGLAFEF